jgi:NitT/TauT family transport system permease protein
MRLSLPLLSRPVLSQSFAAFRKRTVGIDLGVFALIFAGFYGLLALARYWSGAPVPMVAISLSPWALPGYAFFSLVRLFTAYLMSLVFAIAYGYVAATQPRVERVMIALLDILQSIPVLSFLPGVMLAMIALIPAHQLGVELGSILLIFTGQVWNMAFSFYTSQKSIPRELGEASRIFHYGPWQRFIQLELPFGIIGLLWNSMVSVAGGWFFLMACEMFPLGDRQFRLPGLGSYLQTAASAGDVRSICWGIAAMILIIVAIDQLLWRPLIAWSDKFKFEQVESASRSNNAILRLLQRSRLASWLGGVADRAFENFALKMARREVAHAPSAAQPSAWPGRIAGSIVLGLVVLALLHAWEMLRGIAVHEWLTTIASAGITLLRVNGTLLIASAWTIPVGVAIGFHPKLARIAQPLAQIAASVPATALFPIVLLGIIQLGGGLGIASILLMLLGTQWYILFNVIAGALAIPSELREAGSVFRFNRSLRWRVIILPGIFPYLVTGLVTASGGAWNASIVAEYFHLKGQIFMTPGLGAQISKASDAGRFDILLLSTVVMSAMVVCINRLVWRPLYRLAENRYRLEA